MYKKVNLVIRVIKSSSKFQSIRCLSNAAAESIPNNAENGPLKGRMKGYQIHNYGDLDELQLSQTLRKPYIQSPDQVLVKVSASSVNPLDVAMIGGYGSTLLNTMRVGSNDIEFPLTLGRDFTGVVIQRGMNIKDIDLKIGDKVWGVIPPQKQGCHAEYVVADKCNISRKPEKLSDIDASAVLYAGLTAWSGLFVSARLGGITGVCSSSIGSGKGKKVLVLGGSGGVGNFAIQILQAEGARIHATCAPDAISTLQNLGIEKVLDYTALETDGILAQESPYHIILDCAGKGPEYANALPWKFDHFVTFKSPLLRNFDEFGLVSGGLHTIKDMLVSNIPALNKNGSVKWGYFMTSPKGIQYLKKLADQEKLLPIIDSVYKFENLREAYERVQNGHLRGKVVVDFSQ